jgi:hypothetical protein
MRGRRRAVRLAIAGFAVLAVLSPGGARADDDPPVPGALLSATAEAYAYRVEYDLPVPAGTGTVGHVVATAQRSSSVETSHGLAAAPSELGPVVGGRYADPQSTGHPINKLPQVECHHPSDTPTNVFRFPTDTNDDSAGVPATSFAYASCTAGPAVDVRAHAGDPSEPTADVPDDNAAIIASAASVHPDHDVLTAKADSSASGLVFGGGVVRIGAVSATGESHTAGTPGSGASAADVYINDIDVLGVRFSLAFTGSDVTVTAGGASVPLGDAAGQAVIAAANTAVKALGCTLTVGKDPAAYPQGFLFSRPQPDLGVRDDGSLAASYRGGLLLVCDIPDNPVAQATQFSPERFQALIGFVYTSVSAGADVGGFGLADLGGSGGAAPTLDGLALPDTSLGGSSLGTTDLGNALTPGASAGGAAAPAAGSDDGINGVLTTFLEPLPPAARWGLALAALLVWGWLTHLGVTRLLTIGAPRAAHHDDGLA